MITDLRLQHFRSYTDESFELSPGVNIIVGPNASGKTNLLEAVLVLARGSSYRARDAELVQHDQPWARLDCHSDQGAERTVKMVMEPQTLSLPDSVHNSGDTAGNPDQPSQSGRSDTSKFLGKVDKSYELDGQMFQRLSLARSLPVVLFEPNHLRLFSGGPERRRDYLDDLLEQTVAGYGTTRRHYRRALAQRNSLLKQSGGSNRFGNGGDTGNFGNGFGNNIGGTGAGSGTENGNGSHGGSVGNSAQARLFPWDVRLSQLAGVIVRARQELVSSLAVELINLYQQLSGSTTAVTVEYGNRWPVDSYESQFLSRLAASQADDQQRGFTGSGPHREDLIVLFDGHPVADTASRGEVRTVVLALKILELKLIEAARSGSSSDSSLGFGSGSSSNLGSSSSDDQAHGGHTQGQTQSGAKSGGQAPLLLLDDVFSELDGRRRHALTDYLAPYQTFITTTDADLVLQHFAEECHVIPLS